MRPTVIPGPGLFVPAHVAAVLAPPLSRELSKARALGAYVDPDVRETVERLEVVGAAWSNRKRTVPTVPPLLDPRRSENFEWITVQTAAALLHVSDTAVKARLRRGSLRGEKVGGRWRVDAEAVRREARCR
jgi:excisionase family DNA binding protein